MKRLFLIILMFYSSFTYSHCREQVYEDLGHKMDQWETRFFTTLGVGPWLVWPIAAVTGGAAVVIAVPIVAAIYTTGRVYNNSYFRYNISDLDGTKIEDKEMKEIIQKVFKSDLKKLTSEEEKNKKAERILEIIAAGNENEELCPKKIVKKADENTDYYEEDEVVQKYLTLRHIRNYVKARL